MSRVAKMPIAIPAGTDVQISASAITVKGPLGSLTQPLNGLVKVENNNGTLSFDVVNDSRESNAMSGTLRALVNNMSQQYESLLRKANFKGGIPSR